jgi:hypothetical protein
MARLCSTEAYEAVQETLNTFLSNDFKDQHTEFQEIHSTGNEQTAAKFGVFILIQHF